MRKRPFRKKQIQTLRKDGKKRMAVFTWRVSDCEELVGASRQKCD